MTAAAAIAAMLTLYTEPNTWTPDGIAWNAAGKPVSAGSAAATAWSLEGALYRVIGDPDEPGISDAEWRRRDGLVGAVLRAFPIDLMAYNDAARHQDAVTVLLRSAA